MFLENIEAVPFADADAKNQLTGEVYFQRAYNYFCLLRVYGSVPIIAQTFGLDDDEAIKGVSRNTFEVKIRSIS